MTLPTTGAATKYVVRLSDVDRAHLARVGSKAANLGDLARSGFPVPEGFVVTTDSFDRFLAASGLGPDATSEAVANAPLPAEVAEAVSSAIVGLGDLPVAVRSSGVAEDLAGASFAGQYETVLGVRGVEAVAEAVRYCWGSAFSDRVKAYRAGRAGGAAGSMAVLVQRMVPADAAGVAFTANPVTGDRAETVVSAVRGLGERLVSGEATPDEWVVKGDNVVSKTTPEGAIDGNQCRAIADMARRVERHFGCPQDIEWAIAGGELFLLQARPITTLPEERVEPIPVPAIPLPGFWERESAHFQEPLSPFFRSAILPVHEAAATQIFVEASLPMDGIQFREIGGWLYQRMVPPGGKERPAPPSWLMPLIIRLVPRMRRLSKGMVETVRSDMIGVFLERWDSEWKPRAISRAAELRRVDLASLSDEELEQHLSDTLAFVCENIGIHSRVGTLDFMVAEFALACRDLLNWDSQRTLDLISGLSETTSEPSRRLVELARMVEARPEVRALLDRISEATGARLATTDKEFAAAFDTYLQKFGCRIMAWEPADPALEERPQLVLGLIRDQVARVYNPEAEAAAHEQQRASALAEARGILANRTEKDRQRFERALARAQRAFPVRDDHEFYLANVPIAVLRYAVKEVGRRLAERGQIDRADDVFFLELEELRKAFRERNQQQALVARRKAELAWVKAHPGPAIYGTPPGPPPSFAAFPPEARLLMEGTLWMLEAFFATQYSQKAKDAPAGVLSGLAASPGRYVGPVRVIKNESEFAKLRAGDVLVCPTTLAAWSVLFSSVGALVTDSGGILSHPAIISREYRIPGVVATGNATSVLRDGQIVTVDGTRGVVEVQ